MKSNSYVENTLIKGEEIRYQGKVLPIFHLSMVPIVLVLEGTLFGFGNFGQLLTDSSLNRGVLWIVVFLPLLAFVHSWLVVKSTEVAVTNQRVITTTGLFTQTSSELSLDKIESVDVEQGIFGRLLGYGTVSVNGTGGRCNPAPGIANPFEFRRIVQEAANERKGTF